MEGRGLELKSKYGLVKLSRRVVVVGVQSCGVS
jgi:hypothetical protein